MKGAAILSIAAAAAVIGGANAAPPALRGPRAIESEEGGAAVGVEGASMGHTTSNLDSSLPTPSRQVLLEEQQAAAMEREKLRTLRRETRAVPTTLVVDSLEVKVHEDYERIQREVVDWEERRKIENKEYELPIDAITLEGTHLLGGGNIHDLHDFHERHLGLTSSICADDETKISIICKTDDYGYESSWVMYDSSGEIVVSGPPDGTNYDDRKTYSGQWCVPSPGSYKVVVKDSKGDGMCTDGVDGEFGCGFFKVYQDGKAIELIVQDTSNWSSKTIAVNSLAQSSRSDAAVSTSSSASEGFCTKVANAMRMPSGTCTLPNGGRGQRVQVTTKVDKYGEETSWKITSGGVTRMNMEAIVPSYGTKTVEDCLPEGTYEFKISDFDGVCCKHGKGYYSLELDGTEILNGGGFIGSDGHTFKVGYDWVSNMSERDCEWWWAHHTRRQDWHTRCYPEYCNKEYRHLRWSTTLASDAREYAEKLLDTCDTAGISHDHMNEGENLAKNKGKEDWGEMYTADKIVGRFVDNEEFWGWNDNAHLTQALWYASRYIGCGDSVKDLGDGITCRMQVCRYAKAGNCNMNAYSSSVGNNWRKPMMEDDTLCGPTCPDGGCYI